MNKVIKEEWLKNLRNGEYTQAKDTLKSKDGFCCLGVLCDMHRKATKKHKWELDKEHYSYLKQEDILPCDVKIWAELDEANPRVKIREDIHHEVAELNDANCSFEKLADLIEKSL